MSKNEPTRVLVVAAHPDDELLGCGGTIRLHTNNGDRVTSIIACEGESIRYQEGQVDQRSDTLRAAEVLGVNDVRRFEFPDQKLDTINLVDIITKLEDVIADVRPTIIYTQWGGDINRDHKILFEALLVAARPMEAFIETIYAFDTASSTEWAYPRNFVPDTWVDITPVIDDKLSAMSCYKSELRKYPHPRSLEGLKAKAASWGVQCCMDYAEVFMTIRRVKRDGKTPI